MVNRFKAYGRYSDGSLSDLTGLITLSSLTPARATIRPLSNGFYRIYGVASGVATVQVAYAGVTNKITQQIAQMTDYTIDPSQLQRTVGEPTDVKFFGDFAGLGIFGKDLSSSEFDYSPEFATVQYFVDGATVANSYAVVTATSSARGANEIVGAGIFRTQSFTWCSFYNISLNAPATISVGETQQVSVTGFNGFGPVDLTTKITSDNPAVLQYIGGGRIVGVAAGQATLAATLDNPFEECDTLADADVLTVVAPTAISWISAGSGKWEESFRWDVGRAPIPRDLVSITNAASKSVTMDGATPVSTLLISNLTLRAPGSATNTLLLSGLATNSPLRLLAGVALNRGGALLITNAALIASNNFAYLFPLDGVVEVKNGGTLVSGGASLGVNSGSGLLQILGGRMHLLSELNLGYNTGFTGTVVVTGGELIAGSGYCGLSAPGALTVSAGTVSWDNVRVGEFGGAAGSITVSNGTVRLGLADLGGQAGGLGTLTVAGGVTSITNALRLGVDSGSTGVLAVTTGQLFITNHPTVAQLVVGVAGRGIFTLSGGLVTVDQLRATSGSNSVLNFHAGTLAAQTTAITNAQPFVIGNGVAAATFRSRGGAHSFANGWRVRSNATFTGCGTLNNNGLIEGRILADCGGTLTFSGIVTNNGSMIATNGTTLRSLNTLVNNGTIDIRAGKTNFSGVFINNGTIVQ